MGIRKHFNPNRICSSENYETSRKVRQDFIRRQHEQNIVEVREVTESITIKQHYYASCFGKLIEITEIEALRIEKSVKVIRK